MPLAVAMATTLGLGLGLASSARADGFIGPHVLWPCVVPAWDYTTGGQYQAPPIPYGHYAKDYVGDAHKALGHVTGPVHACLGKCAGLLHGMGGCANGMCKDGGFGAGDGQGGFDGADALSGHGLFDHQGASACVVPGCGGGPSCPHQLHGQRAVGTAIVGGGPETMFGGAGAGTVVSSGGIGTAVGGSAQFPQGGPAIAHGGGHAGCGMPGCTIAVGHTHPGFGTGKGGDCGIPGCGVSHTHGGAGVDPGAGTGCSFCGGQGCQKCLAAAHGAIAGLHGKLASLAGLLHPHPKLTYFVGPGGPVPLTPGYVPYIVSTRSPRDYFSFPPRNPNDP
ncbi:MAG TPA: hypothetical protein VKA15_04195 [Isosphaeraceae bacterium]|nr:hypothetical protein [Isosphaeraceae bacterium]